MAHKLFLILVLAMFSGEIAHTQDQDCKVLKPEISGTYAGGCKNGLAQGEGVAQGVDYYKGRFEKGLPDGKGLYKWADGTSYEGHFENGIREGSGIMVYRDSTVKGYWKNDLYAGKKLIPPYEIIRSACVTRSNITKSTGSIYQVRIKIKKGGQDNTPYGFNLTSTSGTEYRSGSIYGIENVTYPVTVRISYKTPSAFGSSLTQVFFDFRINDPGVWDVLIMN